VTQIRSLTSLCADRRGTGVPAVGRVAVPHVGIMGKMPMPRQAATESFSPSSLRLSAFALPLASLFPSAAFAGYPPETEAIHETIEKGCIC